jgi:hypothetical protein
MKKLAVLAIVFFTGCTGSTSFGECVGISTDQDNPTLVYKISVWNTFWSALSFQTIITPILWATDFARCPVGIKK